jgi:Family of unknown function (DUF6499)
VLKDRCESALRGLFGAPRGASRSPLAGCIAPHSHVIVGSGGDNNCHQYLCGDHTMPSAPDWRSASAYAYLHDLNAAELAAEFLRRNPAYQRDYRATLNSMGDDALAASLTRWGLRFPFRPRRTLGPIPSSLAASSRTRGRSSRGCTRGISRGALHRYAAADIPACSKRWGIQGRHQSSRPHFRRTHRRCHDNDAGRCGHPPRSEFSRAR